MAYMGKTREFLLHLGAGESGFHKAHVLRHTMTAAEKVLWNELKNRKLMGLKFRRQHPIHCYIADFYCHEQKLVIEVDGGIHDDEGQIEHDTTRTEELNHFGIKLLRFKNEEVLLNIEKVLEKIGNQIRSNSI
jgi:very-short-patch-repair endonuclease